MKVKVAFPTGFCFGVRRALKALEEALAAHGEVYSLGSPIHNERVVEEMVSKGLRLVEDPEEVPPGGVSFVRAHGVSAATMEALKVRSSLVVDGTCPFVRRVQMKAKELASEGYAVVVVGDPTHPEVVGIVGHVPGDRVFVVASRGEIKVDLFKSFGKIGVVCQTTNRVEAFKEVVSELVGLVEEVKVHNTICDATVARQEAVRRLAAEVDAVVVVGSRSSANTRKLLEIASSLGEALLVEDVSDLERGWFRGKREIGVAAGASTPDCLIEKVVEELEGIEV